MDRPSSVSRTLFRKLAYNNAELDCGNYTAVVGDSRVPLQRYLKTYPSKQAIVELFMEIGHVCSRLRVETTDTVDLFPDYKPVQPIAPQEKQIVTCLLTDLIKKMPARYTMYHMDKGHEQIAICVGLPSLKRTKDIDVTMLEKQYSLLAGERQQLSEKNMDISMLTKSMDELCVKFAQNEPQNKPVRVRIDPEEKIRDNYRALIIRQEILNNAYSLFNDGADPGIGMTKEQIEAELTTTFLDIEAITSQYHESIWNPKPAAVKPKPDVQMVEWGTEIEVEIGTRKTTAAELIKEGYTWLKQLIMFAGAQNMNMIWLNTSTYSMLVQLKYITDNCDITDAHAKRFAGALIPVVQTMVSNNVIADFKFGGIQKTLNETTNGYVYQAITIQAKRELQVATLVYPPISVNVLY